MGFNEKNGLWNCYSCGFSGQWYIGLTMKSLALSYEDAVEFVLQFIFGATTEQYQKTIQRTLKKEPKKLDENTLPGVAIEYLYSRGISQEFALSKGLFWSSEMNRIVIPIGRGWWIARGIHDEFPKYFNSEGLPKGEMLYNYDLYKTERRIFVTEGVFDAWKVEMAGFPCVATFGSIALGQLELLNDFPAVVVVPDNDAGGETFAAKLSILTKPRLYVVTLDRKDAGEYSNIGELRQVLYSSKEFWKVYSRVFH